MELIEIPRPTSLRQAAQWYSTNSIDLLVSAFNHLKDARRCAKYRVTSYSCWGDLPESVFVSGVPFITGRWFEQQLVRVARRWKRLLYDVSKKQDDVELALKLKETHRRPGEVFSCKDSRVRRLLREPNPILAREHRDATGQLWRIVP
jgi:hypothetical protein